jgi:hypothetical protein
VIYQTLHGMKVCFLILVSFFPITISQQESKLDLICQKWRLFEIQEHNQPPISIEKSKASTMILGKDGTFEKNIPGMYQERGKWEFNYDSSKLKFVVMERQGSGMGVYALITPIDSIVKLTKDTLIYCSPSFRGRKQIAVNINWCYVKEQ